MLALRPDQPEVRVTITRHGSRWCAAVEWPTHPERGACDIYNEPSIQALAEAVRQAILMGEGETP